MPELDELSKELRDEIVAMLNRLADRTPFQVDDNVVGLLDIMFKAEHVENTLIEVLGAITARVKQMG